MSYGRGSPPRRRKLALDDSGSAEEQAAERAAQQVITPEPGVHARRLAGLGEPSEASASPPPSVYETVAAPGRELSGALRGDMENRFDAVFGSVRLHTDGDAQRSAREIDAQAYTVGNDVVFSAGRFAPDTREGRHLLAHELAHVVQSRESTTVHRYRNGSKSSSPFAFGERNTATLVEQSFDPKTDKQTKPWVELVTVEFTSTQTDADGNEFWVGTATAQYYPNPVSLPAFTFLVGGGSRQLGRTDSGTFRVHRIEGYGYNSGSASGTPGVDFNWSDREGPNRRYSKQDSVTKERAANMSFAVFYNRGEALHAGPLDESSHGCVHVDWFQEDLMKQLNYHSVIGLTRVTVKYSRPTSPPPPTTP